MIASLMMYARPETAVENARYWTHLRASLAARGIETPSALSNDADTFDVWLSPELVLSQTCGLPYRTRLVDQVTYVGTVDYGLLGCPPGYYASAVVVRADDARQSLSDFAAARFAYNQTNSQSGYAAAYTAAKACGFWFRDRYETGAHAASARMVAEGKADIAALDGQTWRDIETYDNCAHKLRVLMWTKPTPGLPYITGKHVDGSLVFDAVAETIAALDNETRQTLGMRGIISIPKQDYVEVETPTESR